MKDAGAHASVALERHVEVVAALGLEVGVAVDHLYARHVEVHVHLLERGGAEAAGIGGAYGEGLEAEHQGGACRHGVVVGGREIVVAHACHHVEPFEGSVVGL